MPLKDTRALAAPDNFLNCWCNYPHKPFPDSGISTVGVKLVYTKDGKYSMPLFVFLSKRQNIYSYYNLNINICKDQKRRILTNLFANN